MDLADLQIFRSSCMRGITAGPLHLHRVQSNGPRACGQLEADSASIVYIYFFIFSKASACTSRRPATLLPGYDA